MMRPSLGVDVFLCRHPIDMRKSIDGLTVLVEGTLDRRVFSGSLFVFTNKRRDKLKILYFETSGFVVWYKRLEEARFHWPKGFDGESRSITAQQLHWLLDGYNIEAMKPHAPLRYTAVT